VTILGNPTLPHRSPTVKEPALRVSVVMLSLTLHVNKWLAHNSLNPLLLQIGGSRAQEEEKRRREKSLAITNGRGASVSLAGANGHTN
jgi:hypothetical protein